MHLQQCKNFSVALYNFIVHVHNSRDYQCRVNRLSNSQRVCMVLEHFTGRVNYSTLIYNLPTDSIYFVIKGVFSTHHCHIAYLVHVSGDVYNCLYCKYLPGMSLYVQNVHVTTTDPLWTEFLIFAMKKSTVNNIYFNNLQLYKGKGGGEPCGQVSPTFEVWGLVSGRCPIIACK